MRIIKEALFAFFSVFVVAFGLVSMLYLPIVTAEALTEIGWSSFDVAFFLAVLMIWAWLVGPILGSLSKIWGDVFGSEKTRDR